MRAMGLVLGGALLTGLVPAAVTAQTAPPAGCPTPIPTAELTSGMMGTGYTVSRGKVPQPFDAEILGIYPDGILPGRDLVIAEVHSAAIDKVGGVWAGMSGSPVYVNDGGTEKLVGAVAWSFSFGPSHVIGLTPAQDMLDLLDYGVTSATSGSGAPKVALTTAMRKDVAAATGRSLARVGDSLVQMTMPVSVTGLGPRTPARVRRVLSKHLNAPVRLYAGSSVSSGEQAAADEMVPGGNFAAALSYGDITFAGVGTTTLVCDDAAVAFGHPFFFDGKTTLGANAADAITVWEDPVFGPFKLATIEGGVGVVDQDRFAGIRADFSQQLDSIPVTSRTIAENTDRTSSGRSDVLLSEWVPVIAFYQEYYDIVSTMDQFSEGSSEFRWVAKGTKANGSPWRLERANMGASGYDIAYESVHELIHILDRLYYQDYEDIEFTSFDFEEVTVRDEIRQYKIGKVLVAVNGGRFRGREAVRVRPGARLELKVVLRPYDESPAKNVRMSLRVPRTAKRSGELAVFGGPGQHTGVVGPAESFDELLEVIKSHPKNNEAGAKLRLGRGTADRARVTMDQVVKGGRSIRVFIKGARGSGGRAPRVK